jgi:hypothetical protein
MDQIRFLARLGTVLWWPFGRVRPQLRSALWVLYVGAFAALVVLMRERLFGDRSGIDFKLLGHFIGSAGLGALTSALIWGPEDGIALGWLRVVVFGAVSGLVFGLIVQLQHGPPIDAIDYSISAIIAAVIFPLVRWAALKGHHEST